MQQLHLDDEGRVRFRSNAIVEALLERCRDTGYTLNEILGEKFSEDDVVQFWQLIGYSLGGYHELSFIPDADCKEATEAARAAGLLETHPAGFCRDIGCQVHCGVERRDP